MTGYAADAGMLAMQREARERVRAMQERGRLMAEGTSAAESKDSADEASKEQSTAAAGDSGTEKNAPVRDLTSVFDSLLGGNGAFSSLGESLQRAVGSASAPAAKLLDTFGLGGEELLILMVMYAVFKEHGDTPLLLALGYLLL